MLPLSAGARLTLIDPLLPVVLWRSGLSSACEQRDTEEREHLPLTDWCRGNMRGGPLVLPVCADCATCAELLA